MAEEIRAQHGGCPASGGAGFAQQRREFRAESVLVGPIADAAGHERDTTRATALGDELLQGFGRNRRGQRKQEQVDGVVAQRRHVGPARMAEEFLLARFDDHEIVGGQRVVAEIVENGAADSVLLGRDARQRDAVRCAQCVKKSCRWSEPGRRHRSAAADGIKRTREAFRIERHGIQFQQREALGLGHLGQCPE